MVRPSASGPAPGAPGPPLAPKNRATWASDRLLRRGRIGLPGSLQAGLLILGGLLALAMLAPLLATDHPWLARSQAGIKLPAFSQWLTGSPGKPVDPADSLVRAPIPYGPQKLDLSHGLAGPSKTHWMGTDPLGRDLGARVIHGARVSMSVGLLSALFALLLGIPLGALAGYRGGLADAAVSRSIEAILCFPSLLLILAILSAGPAWFGGVSDVTRVALVLGLTGWVAIARYLRAEFIKLRNSEMVLAARAIGVGHLRIALRYLLPASLAPVVVTAAFSVGAAITAEAGLSFLGLGVGSSTATWGGLLNEAREPVQRGAWWLATFPGLALFAAVLGCNLVGDGIRDYFDPRQQR